MKNISHWLTQRPIRNMLKAFSPKPAHLRRFSLSMKVGNVPSVPTLRRSLPDGKKSGLPTISKIYVISDGATTNKIEPMAGRYTPIPNEAPEMFLANAQIAADRILKKEYAPSKMDLEYFRQFFDSTLSMIYSQEKDSYYSNALSTRHDAFSKPTHSCASNPRQTTTEYNRNIGKVAEQAGLNGAEDKHGHFVPRGAGTNPIMSAVLTDVFKSHLQYMQNPALTKPINDYVTRELADKYVEFAKIVEKQLEQRAVTPDEQSTHSDANAIEGVKKQGEATALASNPLEDRLRKLISTTPDKFKHDLARCAQ